MNATDYAEVLATLEEQAYRTARTKLASNNHNNPSQRAFYRMEQVGEFTAEFGEETLAIATAAFERGWDRFLTEIPDEYYADPGRAKYDQRAGKWITW